MRLTRSTNRIQTATPATSSRLRIIFGPEAGTEITFRTAGVVAPTMLPTSP